jgi:thymidylate synthase (FAD)
MSKTVTILTGEPTVIPIAEMRLAAIGLESMAEWVRSHRPECLPDEYQSWRDLFPHGLTDDTQPSNSEATVQEDRALTDNELLVELAGRKCYDSFGRKAGKKSNREYIEHTQSGDIPHASILYHAKMSFFIAGLSRRVSHEFIRNYVGADRSEEGNPSQESTRFTHHYGFFVAPPRYLEPSAHVHAMSKHFRESMQAAYDNYLKAVDTECAWFEAKYGKKPTSIDKKRIYEAASSFLPHQAETSFIWTSNPAAIAKFVRERDNPAADLEIQRFARTWKRLCVGRWPNLFPQPFMKE